MARIEPEWTHELPQSAEPARVVKQLTLQIPGSTGNLGPGFDSLALALSIYTKITFQLLEHNEVGRPFITLRGEIADRSQVSDQGALIYNMLTEMWKHDQNVLERMRIVIDSEIPLGYGLGSSSSAVLGAVWASYYFKDLLPTTNDLLTEGTKLEGHPENLAASMMGNMVVCARSGHGQQIVAERIKWPKRWKILMVVPSYSLTTKAARKVLPQRIDFDIAAGNLQRTALLVAAVSNASEPSMREALVDKMHEPYRENLVPELSAVRKLLAYEPIIGSFLSGAGSSVAVVVNAERKDEIKALLENWRVSQPSRPKLLDLEVDGEGAQILHAE